MKYLFIALQQHSVEPHDLGFADATFIDSYHSNGVWRIWINDNALIFSKVADLLQKKILRSAYAGDEQLLKERPYLAFEWPGKLIADYEAAGWVHNRLPKWSLKQLPQLSIFAFSPPELAEEMAEGAPEEYRSWLNRPEPRFFAMSREAILQNPRAWFGDFAEDDYGGWVAIFSAAPSNGATLRLGNLAALGFKHDQSTDSAWANQRSHKIRIRSLGLNYSQFESDRWYMEAGFRLEREQFRIPSFVEIHSSRQLQSICKDMNFVIRFGRIGCGGGNDGCEGDFGKEVCCAAER
jgi:hypothetical protein